MENREKAIQHILNDLTYAEKLLLWELLKQLMHNGR